MYLEGVIVCKDYGDFLEETLPRNLPHFDRLVVVTHHEDKRTQALCSRYSVECIQTACMHQGGDAFNKGRAINLGLGHLRGGGWILHLDADIVLPYGFRQMLAHAELQKPNIYGADRANVFGYDSWQEHRGKLSPHWESHYFVQAPRAFPIGARIVHREHGYTPIGYFQLWHSSAGKRYPIHQGNAEHTDVLFSVQWTRTQRILLPEIIVYHLDSLPGPAPMGANWNGRKTPEFCPRKPKPHKPPYCCSGDSG